MPANEKHLTSIIKSFNLYLDQLELDSKTEEVVLLAFLDFLKTKNDLNRWSETEIDRFLTKNASKYSRLDEVRSVLNQFVNQYPPYQTTVFLSEFLLALSMDNCSYATLKNYRSDISQFITFAKEKDLNRLITKPKVVSFLKFQAQKGLKPASIKRKLASISQFAFWAKDQGSVNDNLKWLEKLKRGIENEKLESKNEELETRKRYNARTNDEKNLRSSVLPTKFIAGSNSNSSKHNPTAQESQDFRARLDARLASLNQRVRYTARKQVLPYLNLALIILFVLGLGVFGWRQFKTQTEKPLAYPNQLTRPSRSLSFQGRLTDTAQNPVTGTATMRFKLYDSNTNGSTLWDSGNCTVDPDQDGIFTVSLGDDCGSEISQDVFTENSNVWLEVETEGETLSPRQPIKTVAYALNSETLQGYPASASAVENTVLVMDDNGEVVLGNANPKLKATGDSFSIEAETMTLQTTSGSNGDISLSPDGTGRVNINSDLALDGFLEAPGATLSANYAGGTALVLKGGPSGTGDIMQWQDGTGTTLGEVDADGNLGIGTTNPSQKLHVDGSLRLTGALYDSNNSAGSNNYVLTSSDGGTKVVWADVASGGVSPWTYSDPYLYPDNAGDQVGIGTTTTADMISQLYVTNGSTLGKALAIFNQTEEQPILVASKSGSTKFIVDTNGNVGVGTESPGYKLNVVGTAGFSSSIHAPSIGTGTDNSVVILNTSGDLVTDEIDSKVWGGSLVDGSGTTNYLSKWTPDGDTLGDSVVYDDGTNVGIGTTSPSQKLHVEGGIRLGSTSNANNVLDTAAQSGAASGSLYWGNSELLTSANLSNFGVSSVDDDGNGTMTVSPTTGDVKISINLANANTWTGLQTFNNLAIADTDVALTGSSINLSATGNFSINTDDLYVEKSSGNVGIGTTSPGTAKLAVVGAGNTMLKTVGGASGNPSIELWQDTTQKAYLQYIDSGDYLRIVDNGQVGLVQKNGNVGIGTTTPSQKLDVSGSIRVTGAYYDSNNSAGTSGYVLTSTGTGATWADVASGGVSPWTYSDPYLYPDNAGDQVGIGTTTTADMISQLYVTNGSTLGKALAIFNQTEEQPILVASKSGSTKFIVDTNGNVGVGTESPSDKLEISDGNIILDNDYGLRGWNTTKTLNRPMIQINASNQLQIGSNTTAVVDTLVYAGGNGEIRLLPAGGSSEVRIDMNGNVGIGTTSPSTGLEVLKTTEQLRLGYDSSNYASFTVNSAGDLTIAPTSAKTNITGDLDVSDQLAVGASASITANQTVRIQQNFNTDDATYQIYSHPTITSPTLTADRHSYGMYMDLVNNKTEDTTNGFDSDATGGFFRVYTSSTDTFRYNYGLRGYAQNYSTATSNLGYLYGVAGTANQYADSGTLPGAYGILGSVQGDTTAGSTSVITDARGVYATINPYNTDITNAFGSYNYVHTTNNYDGNITTAYGTYNQVRNDDGSGTASITTAKAGYFLTNRRAGANLFTTAYGIQSVVQDATTAYGLYTDVSDADITTAWGLYVTGEDKNYFSGNVGIGSTNPAYQLDVVSGDAIAASFDGRVIGSDAVNSNEFVTKSQLDAVDAGTLPSGTSGQTLRYDGTDWVANSTLYNDGTNIGIGTTTPAQKLQVVGSIQGDSFLDNSNPNYYLNPADINISLTTAGNVGVGTTNPLYNLEVQSAADAAIFLEADTDNATESDNAFLKLSQDGGAVTSILGTVGTAGYDPENNTYTDTLANTTLLGTLNAYPLQLGANGTVRLTIDTSGNVGIGTTSPDAKLHIANGNILLDNSYHLKGDRGDGSISALIGTDGSQIIIGESTSVPSSVKIMTPIDAGQGVGIYNGSTNIAWFENDGNVGIGTTGPNHRLEISGGGSEPLYVNSGSYDQNSRFYSSDDIISLVLQDSDSDYGIGINGTNFAIDNNPALSSPEFVITNTGSVGIGTTTPLGTLDVEGTIFSRAGLTNNLIPDPQFSQGGNYWSNSSSWIQEEVELDNGDITNAAKVYTDGNVVVYSDYVPVDPYKTYRFTIWIKSDDSTTGTRYLGYDIYDSSKTEIDSYNSSGTAGNNYYFWYGDITANKWKKVTGYLLPCNAGTGWTDPADTTSKNYRMNCSTAYVKMRFLNYYNSGTYVTNWFALPSIEEVQSSQTTFNHNYSDYIIKPSGNVGIGTTSPDAKLDVAGSSILGSSATDTTTINGYLFRGLPIRFTRTTAAINASVSTKDSTCTSEFGNAYQAASVGDVAFNIKGGGSINSTSFTVRDYTNRRFRINTDYANNGATQIASTYDTSSSVSVACVRKDAPLLISRTTAAYNASDATKDSACSTDYGSNYRAANHPETAAYFSGAGPVSYTTFFNVAGNTSNSFYATYNGTYYTSYIVNTTGGTYGVACIMKDPAGGADYAETIPASVPDLQAGEILTTDPKQPKSVTRSTKPYQKAIVGVVPTQPGLVIGEEIKEGYSTTVALAGRVPLKVATKNGPIKIGDPVTSSSLPGIGMKATKPGYIVGTALTSFESDNPGEIGEIVVFVNPGFSWAGAQITDQGLLNLTQPSWTTNDQDELTTSKLVNLAQATIDMVQTQLTKTKNLVVTETAQIANLDVSNLSISGVSLRDYINQVVSERENTQTTTQTASTSPTPTPNTEQLAQQLDGADLDINLIQAQQGEVAQLETNSVKTTNLEATGSTKLGELTATSASISGILEAESVRTQRLEAEKAKLNQVDATIANLNTATVSGTLYAETIDALDQKIAQAFETSDLVQVVKEKLGLEEDSDSVYLNDIGLLGDDALVSASFSAELNKSLVDLDLNEDATVITADAAFIDQYFKVNGSAYVADSLGIGNQLFAYNQKQTVQFSANYLAFNYTEGYESDGKLLFAIQPSGEGVLAMVGDTLVVDGSGRVSVNADLDVKGNVKVGGTLLTDLIQPTDFDNPLQIKVAGVSTESGQVKQSRFEIIDETGSPVATISAQGKAEFAGGLSVKSDSYNLDEIQVASQSANLAINTDKTAGKAVLPAGQSKLVIKSDLINKKTLIYVTPLGSTNNQVLYVADQTNTTDQAGEHIPGQFSVNLNSPLNHDLEFNWWMVN